MKKIIFTGIILISFGLYAKAQTSTNSISGGGLGSDLIFVGYEVSIPTNNGFLTRTSWRGGRFDYRRMVKSNVSVGFAISFNQFEQYFDTQTYQRKDGSGAVTSDMIRRVHTTPMTASVHYYAQAKSTRPYVGLGIGAEYSRQHAIFNIYDVVDYNWGFVVRPEVGILNQFSANVGGYLSVSYNYSTNRNTGFNIKSLSQFPITAGVIFKAN